jgi:hypothetical protein
LGPITTETFGINFLQALTKRGGTIARPTDNITGFAPRRQLNTIHLTGATATTFMHTDVDDAGDHSTKGYNAKTTTDKTLPALPLSSLSFLFG